LLELPRSCNDRHRTGSPVRARCLGHRPALRVRKPERVASSGWASLVTPDPGHPAQRPTLTAPVGSPGWSPRAGSVARVARTPLVVRCLDDVVYLPLGRVHVVQPVVGADRLRVGRCPGAHARTRTRHPRVPGAPVTSPAKAALELPPTRTTANVVAGPVVLAVRDAPTTEPRSARAADTASWMVAGESGASGRSEEPFHRWSIGVRVSQPERGGSLGGHRLSSSKAGRELPCLQCLFQLA
jgi:hypothetical protein